MTQTDTRNCALSSVSGSSSCAAGMAMRCLHKNIHTVSCLLRHFWASHVLRPLLLCLLLPILLVFFSYSCPLLLLLPILLLLLLLLLFFSFSAAPPPPPPPLLLLVFCCSSNIKLIACRSSPNGRHCHRWTAASVSSSSSGVCSTCSWEPCLAAPSSVNLPSPSKTQVTSMYMLS